MIPQNRTVVSGDFSRLLDLLSPKQLAKLNALVHSGKPFTYEPKRGVKVWSLGEMVLCEISGVGR